MPTLSHFQQLPLELLEIIGANLSVQSYCNLRETCRNAGKLNKVAKLNLKAFQESAIGWTAKNEQFMDNVHLAISSYSSSSFKWMCDHYVGEEVMRMIRNDSKILEKITLGKKYYKTFTLKWAAANGHVDVIQTLLQDFRVDPSVDNNYAIRFASRKGHTEVVQLLLQDSRVDPAAYDNNANLYASEYGRTEVVQLLLQDPRVDPSARFNKAIHVAGRNGHIDIVRLLLQDPRVDPAARDNYAIRMASQNGHIDIVNLLLQDARVDLPMD